MTSLKRALVISQSDLLHDPRVRREIDWLTQSGWTVDTLGLGEMPDPSVRDHFTLGPQARWVRSTLGVLVIYGLLPHRTQFKLLTEDCIPDEAERRVREGEYELILFNDMELIPWVGNSRTFNPAMAATRAHLDLHEYRDPALPMNTPWKILTRRYYKWVRSFVGNARFASRTTVASRLADLWAEELGIEKPTLVRNIPPFEDQKPSPLDGDRVRIIFHGLASPQRGLQEIVDAVRMLDDRFSATFMLKGRAEVIDEIAATFTDIPDRIKIVPPVPMRDLSRVVNEYDVEIMFYRPLTHNLTYALPNKFFEAVQGRLALVVGESPMMAELVRKYGIGIVVSGWEASDLAAALSSLDAKTLAGFKAASDRAAHELNAESEGAAMLAAVTGAPTPSGS